VSYGLSAETDICSLADDILDSEGRCRRLRSIHV